MVRKLLERHRSPLGYRWLGSYHRTRCRSQAGCVGIVRSTISERLVRLADEIGSRLQLYDHGRIREEPRGCHLDHSSVEMVFTQQVLDWELARLTREYSTPRGKVLLARHQGEIAGGILSTLTST
jgi:hypothetical protein